MFNEQYLITVLNRNKLTQHTTLRNEDDAICLANHIEEESVEFHTMPDVIKL